MGSSPVVNGACWGSVSPILLNLTIPGDGRRGQPDGEVASTDQGAIVGGPVPDVVLRLVRGMDSRLHPSSLNCRLDTSHRIRAPTPRVVGVGGFRDPEYLVRRAAQPHDLASVCVPASAIALPCPWRRPAPKPRRARALPLQLCPTAQRVAVRARNQDASHAGRSGEYAIGLGRHFYSLPSHSAYSCRDR